MKIVILVVFFINLLCGSFGASLFARKGRLCDLIFASFFLALAGTCYLLLIMN